MLPALLVVCRRFLPELPSRLLSMLVVGLAFAASHMFGPTAGPFRGDYFATRVAVPGAAMSAAYLWISPAFIVAAHCTAHVVMPFLFN